jgi:two-component system NtrC family response regulator/two-component system response regulator HydG
VVDHESNARGALGALLAEAGYEVETATATEEAVDRLGDFAPHLVLADLELPRLGGAQLMTALAEQGATPAALLLLVRRELVPSAVRGLAAGADGYLVKPIHGEALRLLAERLIDDNRLRACNDSMRRRLRGQRALRRLVGASAPIQAVREALAQAAETAAPVLLAGERGTGKLLAAQILHECRSPAGRFVPVACARLSRVDLLGALAQADRGTLFLDEVADLSPPAQELLASFLAGRPDRLADRPIRWPSPAIAAATRRDLAAEVGASRFAGELAQLLEPIAIAMPPLRDRRGDIPLLADHFLRQAAAGRGQVTSAPDLLAAIPATLLREHGWPGNVAELRRLLEDRPAAGREPAAPAGPG